MAATADYLIPTPALRRWVIDLLRAAGASDLEATRVAERVVGASVAGDPERGLGEVPGHVRVLLSDGPSALATLRGDAPPQAPSTRATPDAAGHAAGGGSPATSSGDDAGQRARARRAQQMPIDARTMTLLDQAAASVAARSGLAPGPLSALECGC